MKLKQMRLRWIDPVWQPHDLTYGVFYDTIVEADELTGITKVHCKSHSYTYENVFALLRNWSAF
jgi:hypothetical protein